MGRCLGQSGMKSFKGTVNRKYPDGTAIPEKLPPAYELGSSSKN